MNHPEKKELYNFKIVTIIAIVINSLGVLINLITFFHIDIIIDLFPKASAYLFETGVIEEHVSGLVMFVSEDHFLESVIYVTSSVLSLLALIFVLKKKVIISFRFLQFSMAGLLLIMGHKFIIDIDTETLDVVELLLVFLFLSSLFYHFLHLRKNGWFSFSSTCLRTSSSLIIQIGCQYNCGFCTVPEIQGLAKSDTLEHIVENANELASNGVKEIILQGDDVAEFGKGHLGDLDHEHTFFDLMKTLDKVGEIERFRFSTISTPLISEKTLTFYSSSRRFSPHFSIGLQSGSNEMLKLIPRVYKREQYEQLFNNIKELMPHAYISVNIVVGFPGETDELFEETYNFLKKLLTISHIHVKAYTENKNDLGHTIKKGVVLKDKRIKRRKILNELSEEKLTRFYKSQLGSERNILFEIGNHDGVIYGYTENHIKVKLDWNPLLENSVHRVQLTKIDNDGFMLFDFLDYKPINTRDFRI